MQALGPLAMYDIAMYIHIYIYVDYFTQISRANVKMLRYMSRLLRLVEKSNL